MTHPILILTRRLAFAFAAILFISSPAFAGEPIPGVGIGLGSNPGGIMVRAKTDSSGSFKFPIAEPGSYTIKLIAEEVTNTIYYRRRAGTPRSDIIMTFAPSSSMTVNGKRTYGPITLSTTQTTTINITLLKAVSISGTITTGAKRNK